MDKLRSIQVFCEVVRQGSFSAAAESLQLVNSAVSRQVAELEQWLGGRLLYRTTRSQSLTEEGKRYFDRFESLLGSLAEIEQMASNQRDEVVGALRVTTFPFLARYLLNPVLPGFLRDHPKVRISLILTDRLVSLVDEGFDLALRVGVLSDSTLIARQIGTVYMRTIASPDYLRQHGEPMQPDELANHNCLYDSVLDRHNLRWDFVDGERRTSVPVEGNLVVNGGEMITDMARMGIGIGYLPSFFVDDHIRRGELVEILRDYNDITFPLSIVYPQNRQTSRALRALIDRLVAHYEGMVEAGEAPG